MSFLEVLSYYLPMLPIAAALVLAQLGLSWAVHRAARRSLICPHGV